MALVSLPLEILELVFFYLPPIDVVRCRRINKRCRGLVDRSTWLQLQTELAYNGKRLNPLSMVPKSSAKTLLARVKRTRKAFENLDPAFSWRFKFSDLQDDYLLEIHDGSWSIWDSEGKVYYEQSKPPQLSGSVWSRVVNPRQPENERGSVVTCPLCDLLLLVSAVEASANATKWRIDFLTVSSGEPHPLAKVHPLVLFTPRIRCFTPRTGFCGSTLLLQLREDADGFLLLSLNWKTGKELMRYKAFSGILLSQDLLLVLERNESGPQTLAVINIPSRNVIHRFRFPELGPIYAAHFERPHGGTDHCIPATGNYTPPLIISDPAIDIVRLEFILVGQRADRVSPSSHASLIISISRLLKKCAPTPTVGKSVQALVSEWDDWGPETSRWLPNNVEVITPNAVSGSKLLAFTNSSDLLGTDIANPTSIPLKGDGVVGNAGQVDDEETPDEVDDDHLVILDFNPRRSWRKHDEKTDDANLSCGGSGGTVISDTENCRIVEFSGVSEWQSKCETIPPIESGLPYRMTIDKRPFRYDTAAMDGDTIAHLLHTNEGCFCKMFTLDPWDGDSAVPKAYEHTPRFLE